MREREWVVVRDRNGTMIVISSTEYRMRAAMCVTQTVIRRCASFEYADGFADALNLVKENQTILLKE